MKKYVIYTAVVGQYDQISQPIVIHSEFDYILFTDNVIEDSVGVWQIRKIPYSNIDNTRIARWVKTHPEILLSEYSYSVWMDANLQIASERFYEIVNNHADAGVLVSSMWHNERDCIYEEAATVAYWELESEKIVVDWLHFLLSEKYPEHNGLFETNVVFRNHKNEKVAEIDSMWWSSIEHYSRRDQLSFNYVLWKGGINCPYFICDSENARNSTCINYISHQNVKTRKVSFSRNNFVFINYYKCVNTEINVSRLKKIYLRIAKTSIPHLLLYLLGQLYRIRIYISRTLM